MHEIASNYREHAMADHRLGYVACHSLCQLWLLGAVLCEYLTDQTAAIRELTEAVRDKP